MNMQFLNLRVLLVLFAIFLTACSSGGGSTDPSPADCSADSTGAADNDGVNLIYSAPCGTFGQVTSWTAYPSINQLPVSGTAVNAEVNYMVHRPDGQAKALVVLLAGGVGDAGITGDAQSSEVFTSSRNFLVRSAQLFADRGYLAVTIDRPSVAVDLVSTFGNIAYDQYRLSQFHTLDLVNVINQINNENLDVFLAGTSRGAMSAYAQQQLAEGVSLSSPVTSGGGLYLNYTIDAVGYPALQADFAVKPVHVLANTQDGCSVSTPANALLFANAVTAAMSVNSVYDDDFGGSNGLGDISSNPCNARTYHGFLGIENAAVSKTTAWMDSVLAQLDTSNQKPTAEAGEYSVNAASTLDIDLAALVTDVDNNTILSVSLWDIVSIYGAGLSLNGSVVTYTPPSGVVQSYQDSFVYRVTDDNGGQGVGSKNGFGVIRVSVSP